MRTHLLWLTAVAAQLAAVAAVAVPVQASASAPPVPHQLVLINGDRLAGGVVLPARRGAGALLTLRANGNTYAIPAVAVPYLGHGLDPGLFDVAALQRAERAGRLPVRVSYRGPRPVLPGVRITRAGRG